MGLLDNLGNLSPEQTQGLLSAASQFFQAGGPSRMPTSFGQALGGGLSAYQNSTIEAEKRKRQEEQDQQMAQLRGLNIQNLQGDIQAEQAKRDRAAKLQQFFVSQQQPQTPTSQAQSVLGRSMAPTLENSAILQAAAPQQPGGQQDEYSRLMSEAQALRSAGFEPEAEQRALQALKFRPEFDQTPRTGNDASGKPITYVLDKSGNKRVIDGVLPRDEMKLSDLGGRMQAYNPYALQPGQSFAKTAAPGEIMSNASAAASRAQAERHFQAGQIAPQFSAELGGFINKPSGANPQGIFTPLAGLNKGPKLTEDQGKATGWLVQAENAYKNLVKVGMDANGNPTSAAKPGFNDALAAIPSLGLTTGLANTFRSPERQKFIQASSSLSEALLRAATGAGVNKDEAAQKVQELTPVFGEDAETTKQKFEAIPLYIESLKVRAGAGAPLAAGVLKTTSSPRKSVLRGQVVDGYRFKGGDPADQNNWEKQ